MSFSWKELGDSLAKIGLPLLGAALPIPGGAALGGALASWISSPSAKPEDILATLTASSEAVMKAKQFEFQHQETILKMQIDAEVAEQQAVNATMQAEAKAEHWPTYSWRPFVGFIFGTMMLGCYFILPLLSIPVPAVPESAWVAMGAVLGVASWHRGAMQVAQAQAGATVAKG